VIECSLAENFESLVVDNAGEGNPIAYPLLGVDEVEKIAPVTNLSDEFCLFLKEL
jgi:hypothetical protein